MRRVEELERAIQELSPDDFARIVQHVHVLEQERWDASSDKADFPAQEASDCRDQGRLVDWPDPE